MVGKRTGRGLLAVTQGIKTSEGHDPTESWEPGGLGGPGQLASLRLGFTANTQLRMNQSSDPFKDNDAKL